MATAPQRIFVFQPVFSHGADLDYRLLGVQHWLADALTRVGLTALSGLMHAEDDRTQLVATTTPTDAQIRSTLVEHGARFGLLTVFAMLGQEPHLAVARLAEVRRGHPLRNRVRLTPSDADPLPVAAHRVFSEVVARAGLGELVSTWTDAFETGETALANNYLTALGCFSSCDLGIPITGPETAVEAALTGVRAGIAPHIQLLPRLIESLRTSGSSDPTTLAALVDAAVSAVGTPPESWRAMLNRFGPSRGPSLPN